MNWAAIYLVTASVSGFFCVALGAFGSHGLKETLSPDMLGVWQTAVQYQFHHTITLAIVGLLLHYAKSGQAMALPVSGGLFVAGILMFCGSLYALALGGPRWLGPVTPLGGVAFMLGWLVLGFAAIKLYR